MKGGVRVLNKNGVTMHCSICGRPDHNMKGHYKYQESQMGPRDAIEDEDYDDPTFVEVHNLFLAFYINLSELLCSSHNSSHFVVQNIFPHLANPGMDCTN